MSAIESKPLKDLLLETKDGDWGQGDPADGLVPFHVIRATDFASASLGDVQTVPLRFLPSHTVQRRTVQLNDVLIETAGGSPGRPTGRTMLITQRVIDSFEGPMTCASFARFLRADSEQIDPRYLYWFLQALYQSGEIEQYQVQHTGVARFQYTQFAATKQVPLPEMHVQQAIAEVLGALDDKIAANTKLAQTSAVLGQALFARSMRAADHQVALCEVTELLSRGVAPKYSDAEDTVVVLNQKCIRDQRVNLDPARRTLVSKVRGDKMLRTDDVLVNSTGQGTLGRVARWTNTGSVTADSHITIVRFDRAKVDPVCAGMALVASQKTIEEMGEGSTGQTELSRIELGKLRIRLPERSRQAELGHRIKAMSEMESARLSENQTLAATRDILLPRLMSGKLRVKDVERVLENAGV